MLSLFTALTLCAGCRDNPLVSEAVAAAEYGGAKFVSSVVCTGTPRTRQLDCREIGIPAAGRLRTSILVQNQVKLRSSNVHYSDTTRIFGFDVTVQNLLSEVIGTPDGTTVSGMKVFYDSGPTVTSWLAPGDTGTIAVANADGYGNFTKAQQPYHFYNQLLQPQDSTPHKRWELLLPPGTNTFSFVLKVFTATPSERKVPATPPEGFLVPIDSVRKLYTDPNLVINHPRLSGPYPRNLIVVLFRSLASQEERQAAVDAVSGQYLGGLRPLYYVQVASDSIGNALWSAIDKLKSLPQVEYAAPDIAWYSVPMYTRPNDGPSWKTADWQLDRALKSTIPNVNCSATDYGIFVAPIRSPVVPKSTSR
jgi:hypothetical protein